jgi:Protein of unknown function (DUF1565)
MSRIRTLLFLLALAAQVPLSSAKVTYAVGTCEPKFTSFTTISAALVATPSPNVVEVCPGTYNEQVVITNPVTLEGVSNGTSTGATIALPPGGLYIDADDDLGDQLAVQVLVYSSNGVNLTNLTVDGTGNNVYEAPIVGVFYKNSSGTIDHLNLLNQWGGSLGAAVWFEGGSANPTATVENSTMLGFQNEGIFAETNSSTSELTATIKGNSLNGAYAICECEEGLKGIAFGPGATATVSGNFVTYTFYGIYAAFTGSVSNNILASTAWGIDIQTDDVSVTSNTIYQGGIGIVADSAVSPVTGNSILAQETGVEFDCVAGSNVHSNTIVNQTKGLNDVPTAAVTTNTFYGVSAIRSVGGC